MGWGGHSVLFSWASMPWALPNWKELRASLSASSKRRLAHCPVLALSGPALSLGPVLPTKTTSSIRLMAGK